MTMNQKGIWLSLVFLTGILVVPLGYSNAEMENQTNSTETSENMTASVNATSQENIGQQISEFVHQATEQFKQQRNETLNAIKDCREKIRDATPDMKSQVADDCHKNLQTIKEKYKDIRQQFQDLFKRFRENITTLRHGGNDTSSTHDKDMAIKKINDDVAKNGLRGLENALKHLKGMGLEHGKMGIENAMQEVNKTRGNESISSNASLSQNVHVSTPPYGGHGDNDNSTHGEGKGKK